MRYLLCKSEKASLVQRVSYIFDIFKLYAIKTGETDEFIVLETFPFGSLEGYPEILFIVGHFDQVYGYLSKNIVSISENIILTITCLPKGLKRFLEYGKQIYSSKNINGITRKYKGCHWGFDFDISDSEIDLYKNRNLDLLQNIKKSMVDIRNIS